jgi:two-component system LytT family response regulator
VKLKVIIVDDEPAAREGLAILISKDKDLTVAAICENGVDAIEQINRHDPHIVLLDIQMPLISGFDVLKSCDQWKGVVIFVTAYEQYAIKAFEHHALDYLLKPFNDDRFQKAIERSKELVVGKLNGERNARLAALLGEAEIGRDFILHKPVSSERLVVKSSGKIYLIPFSDILYIEADDYVVNILRKNETTKLVVRHTLKDFETSLPSDVFFRIHKSFIINIHEIVQLETESGLVVHLSNGISLPVARTQRDLLFTKLNIK